MEGVDEELRPALRVEHVRIVHEGEVDAEPGRPDEKIDLLRGVVDEIDALPLDPLDAGLRHDASMHDVIEIGGAGGRMRLEQIMVRLWNTVALMRADQDPHAELVEPVHEVTRQR